VVFIPEMKLYLRVLAIIIDTDGPGTTSNKKVANKKGMNDCMKFYDNIILNMINHKNNDFRI
jgi:hypothetical protein